MNTRFTCKMVCSATVAFAFFVNVLPAIAAEKPPVIPPNANAFGRTYSEWSVKWWQWANSLPTTAHPLFDTADCSAGQSGKVWFLGGTFTLVPEEPTDPDDPLIVRGEADRECNIPTGKALFFPIINASSVAVVPEDDDRSDQDLLDEAAGLIDLVDPADLSLTIDGQSVEGLVRFRTPSPVFVDGPLPENNLDELPAGSIIREASDGYYVLLPPLSRGLHTIEFSALVEIPGVLIFILDIRYEIVVGS